MFAIVVLLVAVIFTFITPGYEFLVWGIAAALIAARYGVISKVIFIGVFLVGIYFFITEVIPFLV